MALMTDLYDRVVCDSADRDGWMRARRPGLGASDVARYANLDSLTSYVRAKLTHGAFTGNPHTERGHRMEAPILASQGLGQNTLMFHSEDEPLFFATPDAVIDAYHGAQVKTTVHTAGRRVRIPAMHRRQMQWECYVCGFDTVDYLVLRFDADGNPLTLEPERIVFDRDDAEITTILKIARPVLATLTEALKFERMEGPTS
jgi:hypothetical protein